MRHLVFIRHGESALNALSRTTRTYCGQVETPLTEELTPLQEFLRSDRAPAAMGLSELDGFLTGVAIGPELLLWKAPFPPLPHGWPVAGRAIPAGALTSSPLCTMM